MQTSVLAETEAFITKQRESLLAQRQEIVNQQKALQAQLDEVDGMLEKFDIFGGKRRQTGIRRASGSRRSSRREELLKVIGGNKGLTRGEILDKMGMKGNKAGEMSISNALTALIKGKQISRKDRKYVAA
jgi:hypothetical protein